MPATTQTSTSNTETSDLHHRIAILGTGFAGVTAAVRLMESGEQDFVIYERADDVGGTWRDNTYPGCACDVPSHLYSFSFAPNPTWSRAFSPQPEIRDYIKGVAESRGVTSHVRYGHNIEDVSWDDDFQVWRLITSQGERTADIVISAVGGLSSPSIPNIKGIEDFEGPKFHSAEWNHDIDLEGRKVAVIGTGASAIQFVPEIQPEVEQLNVFQRTPAWIMPRRDREIASWEKRLFKRIPIAQKAVRATIYAARELFALPMMHPWIARRTQKIAVDHLERQVPDPELRAKLTPDYAIGCKRILISNRYYRSLGNENVDVVTSGISEVRRNSVVTEDGVEHAADTIIFGTGFKVADMPIGHQVHGRDGRSLHETWEGSPNAHLGTAVPGFPNFFMLMGPNTGLGHTSVTIMIEAQVDLVMGAIDHLGASHATTVEPTVESSESWKAEMDRMSKGTVWTSGGCNSWYLDEHGRNSILWPSFATSFRRRVSTFKPAEFQIEAAKAPAGTVPDKLSV